MNTITTPNFMGKTAKIIEEVRNSICIDDVDTEVLKDILQDALNEYCRMLNGYYEEEYYNELDSARSRAYDEGYDAGHSDGCDDGYENGYADCSAKNNY